jgi:antitoxin component HigA of HigAB toxin-antitoxin module
MSTGSTKNMEKQAFTPGQYHAAMSKIENYISRGFDNLNEKEANHLNELSNKVDEYESRRYPMPMANSVSDLLRAYMVTNKLNGAKLGNILKVSGSTISDILNGKKGISFPLAVKMHQILKIDAEELLNVKIVSSSPARKAASKGQKKESGYIKLNYGKRAAAKKSSAWKATGRK